MDKSLILREIKEHYNFKTNGDFANFLGITSQVLSNWKSRNTYDAELIYTKCLNINPEWLLTGKGEMLKNTEVPAVVVAEPIAYTCEDLLGSIKENNALLISQAKDKEEIISHLKANNAQLASQLKDKEEIISNLKDRMKYLM